jgi:hypothetical protein
VNNVGVAVLFAATGAETPGAAAAAGVVAAAPGAPMRRLPISPRVAAAAVHSIGADAGGESLDPAASEAGAAAVTTGAMAASSASLGTSAGAAAAARGARFGPADAARAAGPSESDDVAVDAREWPLVAGEGRDGPASEEALDPADPLVSAKATGIEAIPAPTPSAKASAPTRPTYRA